MARVLAVSSGGGHWQQLQLILPAFSDQALVVACSACLEDQSVHRLPDCNLRTPLRVLSCAWAAWKLVRKERPEIVVSTGAAPGLLALVCGKLRGARTIWIDSVANAERMSLSGRLAHPVADLWLTQWPHVSDKSGAEYVGAVL